MYYVTIATRTSFLILPKVKIERLKRDSVTETVAQLTDCCVLIIPVRKKNGMRWFEKAQLYSAVKLEFYNLDDLAPKLSGVTNFKVKWKFPRDFVEERKLSIDNFPDLSLDKHPPVGVLSALEIFHWWIPELFGESRLLDDILVYRK